MRNPIIIALATVAFWSIGPWLYGQTVFEGTGAWLAYGVIATWVTVAFGALLPRRDWLAVPLAIAMHALIFCVGAALERDWFYSGIDMVPWSGRVMLAVSQGVFVSSPLVAAWAFDIFREKFRRWAGIEQPT